MTNSHCLASAICALLLVPALMLADSLPPVPDTTQQVPPEPVEVRSSAPKVTNAAGGDLRAVLPPAPQDFPGKYILASVALPGAGEMWKGSRAKGEVFLWSDAAIWLTYGGLNVIGNSRNQDARLFARRFSGASATQTSDEYYVALERYPDSELYNEDVRRVARELYPLDPDKQRAYLENHGYFGDEAWSWGSDSLRLTYWGQRRDARSLLHTAGFFLGAAVVNRLVSAVDVAFFTPSRPQALTGSRLSLLRRVAAIPVANRPGLTLAIRF